MKFIGPATLARTCAAHPKRTLGIWIGVVVLAVVGAALLLPGHLATNATTTNNPDSWKGQHIIDREFPQVGRGIAELLVVQSDQHAVGDAVFRQTVQRLVGAVQGAGAKALGGPPEAGDNGHAQLVQFPLGGHNFTKQDKLATRMLTAMQHTAKQAPGFHAYLYGNATANNDQNTLSQHDLQHGELEFGLPAALIILLLVFGTVVGSLLPIALALVSIVCAVALTGVVSQEWQMSIFAINMISGMGLALGIDYSLFILSRFREQLGHGDSREAAIAAAGATAGRAVLFSGTTFVVALLGLLFVPTTIMRSLAGGAILVAIMAVAAALTLLPALLALLGERVNAWRVPVVGRRMLARQGDLSHGWWERMARRVMRHPLLWGGSVVIVLLIAAYPLLSIKTGEAGVSTLPKSSTSRQGYDAVQQWFPTATAQPVLVVASYAKPNATTELALARLATTSQGSLGIQHSKDGKSALVVLPLHGDPLGTSAVASVRHLRKAPIPNLFHNVPASTHVYVTGFTAFNIDYFDDMHNWALPVIAFVLALSFCILTMVFRSVVIAIKALILNLLSVGASLGILVWVFLDGHGAGWFGFQQVHVLEAWVPLFLFSVLFGLSMDYHVFLLTRMRERYAESGSTTDAVAFGIGSTSRLITGAALIIVAVFAGFASGELVMFQQMGFGVAVALLIDATLVRSILLPAAMAVLGPANWYLPRALRWLPELQLH